MPDLTIQSLENTDQEPWSGDQNDKGLQFVEPFMVNGTRDWREALAAPGLPRVGDAHPTYGAAYVVRVRPGRYGGRAAGDLPGTATGFVFLFVEYAEPQRSGKSPPPSGPESNYTKLDMESRTVTVKWGWAPGAPPNEDDPPNVGPINDGDGVAKNYATPTARVVVFSQLPPPPEQIIRMIGLASVGALNRDRITLPKILDTDWTTGSGQGGSPGTILTLEPGQAQYAGFESPVKRTGSNGAVWYETAHLLKLSEDWLVQWEGKDERGVPITSNAATIDFWRDFGGLW